MYRWIAGQSFTRQKFVYWLKDLNEWYGRFGGNIGNYEEQPVKLSKGGYGKQQQI